MAVNTSLERVGALAEFFDVLCVVVLVLGTLVTVGRAIHVGRIAGGKASYLVARRTFGKALLLALEVLIAADLMRTVSLSLTISSVLALGLLVIVRTVLSFSIQIEMEGDLPWRVGRPGRRPATAVAFGGNGVAGNGLGGNGFTGSAAGHSAGNSAGNLVVQQQRDTARQH
ncbi:MAG: DUF1622 domain-containing protein [Synechococcaceae cyanobacterium]